LNQQRRWANMGPMSYVFPSDVDERPISVIGGGTLGRRIAMVFSAGGSRVYLFSRSADSREAARRFVDEHASYVREQLGLAARSLGTVELFDALEPAVATAWLIVESVSEDLALKKQVFRELDRLAESDAILATNSSSYPSSRLVDAVESPERLLNVHFQMPPELLAVELMSCGRTDAAVIGALVERLSRYGLVPFTVMHESVGFLFNRIWHVARRECLMVVAEDVSTPEEVDRIWRLSLGTALGPFRIMDRIGLDVVLAIEEHYAAIRDGIPTAPRELLRDYVDKGFLGLKSAGASTTTTATDRGRPKRSHDRGVHAASPRPALLRSTPRARSRPPCERGPIAA
jgi:3-hydroxybutyryl-CoA dehydrogenase